MVGIDFARIDSALEFECVFEDTLRLFQERLDKIGEAQVFTSPLIRFQRGTMSFRMSAKVPR